MAAKNEFHAQVGQLFNALLALVVRIIPFFFLGIIAASIFPRHSLPEENVWGELVRRFGFADSPDPGGRGIRRLFRDQHAHELGSFLCGQ